MRITVNFTEIIDFPLRIAYCHFEWLEIDFAGMHLAVAGEQAGVYLGNLRAH